MEGGGVKVRGTSVQRETYGGGEAGMVNRGILNYVFFVTSVFCLDLRERSAYEHGEVFNFSRTALQRNKYEGGLTLTQPTHPPSFRLNVYRECRLTKAEPIDSSMKLSVVQRQRYGGGGKANTVVCFISSVSIPYLLKD